MRYRQNSLGVLSAYRYRKVTEEMLAKVKESTRVLNVEGNERQEPSNSHDSLNIHEAPEVPNLTVHSVYTRHSTFMRS